MRDEILSKANAFKGINELAMKGEIVIYGSTYMANFPFYELINRSALDCAVYNRSIEDMHIDEALELLPVCVLELKPSKVFLHLGEMDISYPEALENYKKIIQTIRAELPKTQIYLLSINGDEAKHYNEYLKKLCDNVKISFIRFPDHACRQDDIKLRFKELCSYFRNGNITFQEAFACAKL